MATALHRSVQFRGATVCYHMYGRSKQALVFIHGWTCDGSLWRLQSPLFQAHCSVLIDLPGHGKSDAPTWDYTQELFAHSMVQVLEQEGIDKAVLIGHSMGGPVSTMILRLFPELVAAIVYVDSFFNLPEYYLTSEQRHELAKRLSDDAKFEAGIRTIVGERATEEHKNEILQVMKRTAAHVRINARTTDTLPVALSDDQIYQIPALHLVTPRYAKFDEHWMSHLPRLQTKLWENHGHFPFLEDAERFNNEIEAVLTEHELGGDIQVNQKQIHHRTEHNH